jgi:hypothetical protein
VCPASTVTGYLGIWDKAMVARPARHLSIKRTCRHLQIVQLSRGARIASTRLTHLSIAATDRTGAWYTSHQCNMGQLQSVGCVLLRTHHHPVARGTVFIWYTVPATLATKHRSAHAQNMHVHQHANWDIESIKCSRQSQHMVRVGTYMYMVRVVQRYMNLQTSLSLG